MTGHDIVCIAELDYDSPVWPICRNLMSKFAKNNNRVLYVESLGLRVPSLFHASDLKKIGRRLRRLLSGLRQPEPHLWVMAPHALPGHHIGWIRTLNRWLLTAQIKATLRKLKMNNPLLWIFLPTGEPLVGRLDEKLVIYYCMDEYLANPGVHVASLKEQEDQLVAKAHAVLVTAPKLVEKFKPLAKRVAWIPCAVDADAFQNKNKPEPDDLKAIPHPRIGFAGNLTRYKVDYELLDSVIRSHPEWSFVFIGPQGAGEPNNQPPAFVTYKNVYVLGEKEYSDIPIYMQNWDIGIIPYRHSKTTDAVFPVKLFEYLAAGLPVVATPLPSLIPFEKFCSLASNAEDFGRELAKALQGAQEGRPERLAMAAKNNWDARVDEISKYLADLLPAT